LAKLKQKKYREDLIYMEALGKDFGGNLCGNDGEGEFEGRIEE